MPGPLLHVGATVICAHGGTATPTSPSTRITINGQPAVTITPPWSIAGCSLPPSGGGPCVSAMWTSGATRVTSDGQPLLISTGTATCTPTGVPLTVVSVQPKVTAT
jgi:hypothetical protein